jgi:dTDP-4-amino-4,6-dideoxygalactose transaminase
MQGNKVTTPPASPRRIPILDLQRQYDQISGEVEQVVLDVLRSGNYILGKHVSRLEEAVAELCGVPHAVAVANGTDALILALWALDVGPGDEVITPPFTFAATAEAIALRGAKPVFVDIDPVTFNMDPKLVERAITANTKVIMPVHLYGQPADMDPIIEIANSHGLKIVEDNAQAIGALYKGRPTGSLGDLGCISFYPTKNLGAAGDAGMVVTRDGALAERLRILRAHGSKQRYYHDMVGVNSRLDEIQAAVLMTKFPLLNDWNARRRDVSKLYEKALSGCAGIVTPQVVPGMTPVWHQYTIRVLDGKRDYLKEQLSARGIDSMCYYPVPLHLQTAFAGNDYSKGDFPLSETVASEVLSLPMYPELSSEQVDIVSSAIKEILGAAQGLPVSMPVSPVVAG